MKFTTILKKVWNALSIIIGTMVIAYVIYFICIGDLQWAAIYVLLWISILLVDLYSKLREILEELKRK